jgi:hypothetical protein
LVTALLACGGDPELFVELVGQLDGEPLCAERLRGRVGKLPRTLALRLPTTFNKLLFGRRDGQDVWGEVMRPDVARRRAGLLAIAGGLWARFSKAGERHVDLTAGEAADSRAAREGVAA